MSHGTEHHLEESHHAEHASHDDFNKRVAMSMAIIAACLAFVTLLSHRAHNQVLQLQLESNIKKTEATDRWNQYQAKNIRKNEYDALGEMMADLAVKPGREKEAEEMVARFKKQVKRYSTTPREEEEDPKEPKELLGLEELARELDAEAKTLSNESKHVHHTADRFDLGELGIELALVLCSVSVLTKNRVFWISGLAVGVVGFIVAMSAYVPALMELSH